MKFYERARRFPPGLIRLLARKKNSKPLTNDEIASASGLSAYEVVLISQKTDWRGIDIDTMRRFTRGCGIDLENARDVKRITVYLKGTRDANGKRVAPTFRYLRRSGQWESFYRPLRDKLAAGK